MKRKLLIIGASGHGKVSADIAAKMNKWKNIAFLDDNQAVTIFMGINVIGKSNDFEAYIQEADFFVAIGNNKIRETILNKIIAKNASVTTLVHPNVVIGTDVSIGAGTVIMAGAVINCCSSIGKGCIINTGCSVDHDNIISDYVHLSPGTHLAGNVKVGTSSWLGIGSIVSNNVNICAHCKTGAGAVVVKDINMAGTYVGVPAKKIH